MKAFEKVVSSNPHKPDVCPIGQGTKKIPPIPLSLKVNNSRLNAVVHCQHIEVQLSQEGIFQKPINTSASTKARFTFVTSSSQIRPLSPKHTFSGPAFASSLHFQYTSFCANIPASDIIVKKIFSNDMPRMALP